MTPPPHHSDNTTNTNQETPITPRGYIYTDWSTTPDDTCVQLCRAVPECEVGEIDLPNCHIFPQPHYTFHKSYYEKSTHLVFYWTEYHRRGNRLYRLYEFETRYYDARKICQQEEGQLAVLDSQVKIQEVLDVMDSKGGHRVTTPTTDVIKATCPGDVELTDTLSLEEETPAGGRHTQRTCQLTLVLCCTYLTHTCQHSCAWKSLTTSPASTSPRSPLCQASPTPPTTPPALLVQRLQDLSEQVRQLQHSAHPTRQPHHTQERHQPPPFTPTRQQWAVYTCVDFLAAHDLRIDLKRRQLLHQPLGIIIPTKRCRRTLPAVTHVSCTSHFDAVLAEYPHLLDTSTTSTISDPGVFHAIVTSGPPCYAKPRRMPPERLEAAKKEFATMV
ncbi:hypothetical protein Pmani_028031 [Petrolisthes manimaculis]|uniref:Uncharacterized protein n=1 Tax=Petrolisthes manimaculis TaxID=1843537 RepID=A0AAE1P089_9EUCA|nr:hypothetical protein Pmani_028031 [Petrolisthes manimaculis]